MKIDKKNTLQLICCLLFLISLVSFLFTGAIYTDGNIKLSLIDITFSSGMQNFYAELPIAFFGLIMSFLFSFFLIFREHKITRKIVTYLGLICGIVLFFHVFINLLNPSEFKTGFAPILAGITAILGSFISLVYEIIKKK